MIFTPRIDEAIKLASRLHSDQFRNDSARTPYISHLVAVAAILSEFTTDEDIIIAGLMHDSLEDVPQYTYAKLVEDCGPRVAEIVKHVTEPLDASKGMFDQLPWLERKQAYLDILKRGGIESAMVSSADKIHNTESFLRDIAEDADIANRFYSSSKNRLWFHEQVLAIVSEKLGDDHHLIKKFESSNQAFKKLVEQV